MLLFGGAALAAGFGIGQLELVGVGVLLAVTPLLSALTIVGSGSRLVHSRTLQPARIPAGQDARVMVRVGNSSSAWPVASVFIEDALPDPLGTKPRYTIGYLGPRAVRDVSYLVRPTVRGNHPVGPLRIRLTDPLGCVRVTRRVGTPSWLLVTPATVPLAAPGGANGSEGEESPRRSLTGVGEQDPVPRQYQYGDELRRVHWPSTAKHGELMVRRDEQHWRERSAVLLDTRRSAHHGEGPHGSLETAVNVAASVAVNLIGSGHELRLHTDRGRVQTATSSDVLEGLALAEASDVPGLHGATSMLAGMRGASPGLVVAVLGAVSAEEAAALSRTGGSGIRVAVLCARAAWPTQYDALRGIREILNSAGWRVLTVSHAAELPPLWRQGTALAGGPLTATGPYAPREGPR